jgi:hypothetical protein
MWDPSRPPINLRIKAFNKRHEIRRLSIPIIPLNARIRFNGIRLTLTIGIDQSDWDEVVIGHGMRVCYGERILQNRFYGPPDVYDLIPSFEEFFCFVGEMVCDAVLGCGVGLVDVDALDWAAELISACASDCVVEDEDSGAAGAVW